MDHSLAVEIFNSQQYCINMGSGGRAVERRICQSKGTVVQSQLPPFRNLALGNFVHPIRDGHCVGSVLVTSQNHYTSLPIN